MKAIDSRKDFNIIGHEEPGGEGVYSQITNNGLRLRIFPSPMGLSPECDVIKEGKGYLRRDVLAERAHNFSIPRRHIYRGKAWRGEGVYLRESVLPDFK